MAVKRIFELIPKNIAHTQRGYGILLVGLIFISAILPYLPGLNNGFIYDDKFLIPRNPVVRGERAVKEIFTRDFNRYFGGKSAYYRPVVDLSYWLEFRLWRENPAGYHLTNMIVHSIVSVLLFLVVRRWAKEQKIALISGLIFALHPAHTQSVCWISGRTDLFCMLFLLCAYYFYTRAREKEEKLELKWLILSLLSFALALFSKEIAVISPVLFFLLELKRGKNLKGIFSQQSLAFYSGWVFLILIYFLIRLQVLGFLFGYPERAFYEWYYQNQLDVSRIATVFKVYFYYLQTLFFPIHLCFESRMLVSNSWLSASLIARICAILFLLGAGLVSLKRFSEFGICILWFFISLLPVVNILPYRELIMEHLVYLPSIGFCLALALIFNQVMENAHRRKKILAQAMLSLILLGYGALTISRQGVWKDELVFWRDAAFKAPLKRRPWYNYGIRVKEKGDVRAAFRAWKLAVKAEPDDSDVHNNLGAIYYEMGDIDSAIFEFEEALRFNPNHQRARLNLEKLIRLRNRGIP